MAGPVAAWHSEHADFRRLLALLQRQVEVFHTGERPNYELMLDIISYLREFADRFHHPREDAAFACLAKRFPEMKPDLARLSQEHRVIAQAGETLLQHLHAILAGTIVPRSEIEVAAATYLASYYGNHIAREEEDVYSRARRKSSLPRTGKRLRTRRPKDATRFSVTSPRRATRNCAGESRWKRSNPQQV